MESFILRVLALQSELKAPKGQTNKFGGYKYRSCEDILEAVKPLLKKYGLSLIHISWKMRMPRPWWHTGEGN